MAIGFPLTRSRLQALDECNRRFWLQWLHQVPWPAAADSAAAEAGMARGREFHRLMERHFLGLQVEPVAPELRALWAAWQEHRLSLPAGRTLPEVTVSAPAAGERLLVRYDLLVLPDDADQPALIVDWKTAARPRSRSALQNDIQTCLYPFVLIEGGSAVAGRELDPDRVELIYWQAAEPADPVRFPYSAADQAADRRRIRALIDRARSLQGADIPPVIEDLSICARCPYRTYCNRPVPAAPPYPEPDALEGVPADDDILEELD